MKYARTIHVIIPAVVVQDTYPPELVDEDMVLVDSIHEVADWLSKSPAVEEHTLEGDKQTVEDIVQAEEGQREVEVDTLLEHLLVELYSS
jgi:hypothetical protein